MEVSICRAPSYHNDKRETEQLRRARHLFLSAQARVPADGRSPLWAPNEKAPAFNRGLQPQALHPARRQVSSFYLRTPGLNSELPTVASLGVRGDRRTGGFSLTARHLGASARPQRR